MVVVQYKTRETRGRCQVFLWTAALPQNDEYEYKRLPFKIIRRNKIMSNNKNLSNLPIKDRDKFLKELQALLNKYNIECREIIIENIYTYISNLEDKSLILTQKDTESILEGILIIL